MHLPTVYIVATDFGSLGLGSAGDVTADRDRAYTDWADAIGDNQPARAFKLDFDAETNALECASEITGDFADELQAIREERGLAVA